MLLKDLFEMARPAKICDTCGKSMAGNHFWYKGGWRCKKSSLADAKKTDDKKDEKKSASKPAEKKGPEPKKKVDQYKAAPKKAEREDDADVDTDDEDVKRAEKTKAEKKQVGSTISASEVKDINADSESEAKAQIRSLFPKATPEQQQKALNIWKSTHKDQVAKH